MKISTTYVYRAHSNDYVLYKVKQVLPRIILVGTYIQRQAEKNTWDMCCLVKPTCRPTPSHSHKACPTPSSLPDAG